MIDKLAPGETLVVDPALPDVSWVFNSVAGPIDYSRITIVCPGNVRMPMTDWFQTIGTRPADDFDGQWLLVNNPKDFGSLDQDGQEILVDAMELEEFRAPAHTSWKFDIDGTEYWVCVEEDAYLCPGGTWLPL